MENLLTLVPRKLLLWKVLSKQDERVEIGAETWPALALGRQNFSCKYQTLQSILSSSAFYADDGWRWASLLSFGQTFNLFWGPLIIIGRRGYSRGQGTISALTWEYCNVCWWAAGGEDTMHNTLPCLQKTPPRAARQTGIERKSSSLLETKCQQKENVLLIEKSKQCAALGISVLVLRAS